MLIRIWFAVRARLALRTVLLITAAALPLAGQERASRTFDLLRPDIKGLDLSGTETGTAGSVRTIFGPPATPLLAEPRSTFRYVVTGALLGAIVGGIWIGERASHGYPGNEAALSPGSARTLGAIVGGVVGAGVAALLRAAKSSPKNRDSAG